MIQIGVRSRKLYCYSRRCAWYIDDHENCTNEVGRDCVWFGSPSIAEMYRNRAVYFHHNEVGGLECLKPPFGWSNILIPGIYVFVWFSLLFCYVYCKKIVNLY